MSPDFTLILGLIWASFHSQSTTLYALFHSFVQLREFTLTCTFRPLYAWLFCFFSFYYHFADYRKVGSIFMWDGVDREQFSWVWTEVTKRTVVHFLMHGLTNRARSKLKKWCSGPARAFPSRTGSLPVREGKHTVFLKVQVCTRCSRFSIYEKKRLTTRKIIFQQSSSTTIHPSSSPLHP